MDLDQLRSNIDKIDEEILALLTKRAEIAAKIGQVKIKNNLSIQHSDREEKILFRLRTQNSSLLSDADIDTIFNSIIKSCRNLQKNLD